MWQLIQAWMPALEMAGFIITALTVIFLRRKNGVDEVGLQTLNTYRMRVEQLESSQKQNIERMHEHTKEIGQLQGELKEKDKELVRMRAILENRNPELTSVLKDIRQFMGKIEKHMEDHTGLIKGMTPAPQLDVTGTRT